MIIKRDLEECERHLDRVQSFVPRVDTRVSALFAISSAQAAVAALNLQVFDLTIWWIGLPAALYFFTLAWTLWHLYWCTHPTLKGGAGSLVYFGEIAKRTETNFIADFGGASAEDIKRDVLAQTWRNAQIVSEKYGHLKFASAGIAAGLFPWLAILLAATAQRGILPTFS
ncbi:Pycsar system effector family protein [Devosia sp. YR412]|uniref:Pycsar system effector family protein n=1 Tax=Devosia sp. YR412 TaxID=1881030 RepID=UPI000B82F5A7|nr:Pycsar system effector family protein [Devosia sp. YR412]